MVPPFSHAGGENLLIDLQLIECLETNAARGDHLCCMRSIGTYPHSRSAFDMEEADAEVNDRVRTSVSRRFWYKATGI
jgi:hypothetical protein